MFGLLQIVVYDRLSSIEPLESRIGLSIGEWLDQPLAGNEVNLQLSTEPMCSAVISH